MIYTTRLLLRLFGEHRRRWAVVLAFALVVTVTESVSAGLVFALVKVLSEGSVDLPVIGAVSTDGGSLTRFAMACGVFFVFRAALFLGQDLVFHRLCYQEGAALEERLLLRYMHLPLDEQRRRTESELVRNVHDSVISVVEGALIPVLAAMAQVLKVVAIVIVMLVATPIPTLAAAVILGPTLLLGARLIRPRVQALGAEVEDMLARSLGIATETLQLAPELRLAGRSQHFASRFGAVRRNLATIVAREETLGRVPMVAGETMLVLFVVGYLAVASTGSGAADALPTVGLFAYAALRVMPSLLAILGLLQSIHFTRSALDAVATDAALLGGDPATDAPWPTSIEVRDVTVRHAGSGRPALDGIDLTLSLGEVVALVGPNGAGKTTLAELLTGLVEPTDGRIRLVGTFAPEGASGIALVSQRIRLLDADIATNVSLTADPTERDDEKVAGVLAAAGLTRLVASLPDGASTVLGADGGRLSGGERQRVAIARALYRDASVILLDEGTSALDAGSRTALAATLTDVRPDRLTVLVTHDVELARLCTRVVVLEEGRVVADGSPADVLDGVTIR